MKARQPQGSGDAQDITGFGGEIGRGARLAKAAAVDGDELKPAGERRLGQPEPAIEGPAVEQHQGRAGAKGFDDQVTTRHRHGMDRAAWPARRHVQGFRIRPRNQAAWR